MQLRKILEQLCAQPGVSGHEREMIGPKVAELIGGETDELGNVYKKIGDGNKKIIVEAHMDEVGFKITRSYHDAWVYFVPIGDLDAQKQFNARVIAVSPSRNYKGVIRGGKTIGEQQIEFWNTDESETLDIKPDDYAYFERRFNLKDGFVISPALDNRGSLAALCLLANSLRPKKDITFYLLGSVHHEQGGSCGFRHFEQKIKPDLVVCLDSAYAKPCDKENNWWLIPEIGMGPAIQTLGRGFLPDTDLVTKLKNVAEQNKIPYQLEIIQPDRVCLSVSYSPSRKVAINIPVQNRHTGESKCSLNDIRNSYKLVKLFLEKVKI